MTTTEKKSKLTFDEWLTRACDYGLECNEVERDECGCKGKCSCHRPPKEVRS